MEAEHDPVSALEEGDASPLLDKYDDGGSPDTSDSRAPAIIMGYGLLEGLSFNGIAANLVIYLGTILHESNAGIAASISTWTGTSYVTPFLGALMADSYWGSYWMILLCSFMEISGMILVTVSALLSSWNLRKLTFFSGLYLTAFGSGGIKSSLLPLGADQFNDDDPAEVLMKASFFNWFYFCMNAGALISSTVIIWVQENVDWLLGFGISTVCMAMAIVAFVFGSNTFRLRKPSGSPIKRVFQVFVASIRKMDCDLPTDTNCLYDPTILGIQKLQHTDEFRFFNKAAVILDSDVKEGTSPNSWRLCSVSQVEELKILLRLLPIWLTGILYSVAYAQLYTTFVEQGKVMNTRISSFLVPPASLYAFEVLSVMFWVLVYDLVIVAAAKCWSGNGHGLSQLQRMGVGHGLMVMTMVVSAIVEFKRLRSAGIGEVISISWQLPQYFLIGGSEVFTYVGQLEFFYSQGPDYMRRLCTAFSLLTCSLGSYLNSVVVAVMTALAAAGGRPGWIPDDLDEGHLDYFFWVLAGLSVLNLLAHVSCARKYTLKKTISEC